MRSDPQPRPDGLTPGDHTLEQESSGRLKIFFGYAAGVGKTYAMLDAALRAKEAGTDVVLGFLAPAAYPDTLALAGGLERLPPLIPPGGGQGEFDLDGALRRRPQLILVDELAHSNNKGARHAKRYQDIAELLRAGIDVYSTMDVQQLESLSDVVSSITGFSAPERVPDQVFDSADQVEIVDLEPSDLLARLRAGTIGGGEGHLLTEQTLAALRELSLRRTADRLERKPSGGDRYPPGPGNTFSSACPALPPTRRSSALLPGWQRHFTAPLPRFSWRLLPFRARATRNAGSCGTICILQRSWAPGSARSTGMTPPFRSRNTLKSAGSPRSCWAAVPRNAAPSWAPRV